MNVRSHLDAFDEYCAFNNGLIHGPGVDEPVTRSHVRLGSLDKIIHFSSLAEILSKHIGLHDLRATLATFLRLNCIPNATDNVISSAEVRTVHLYDQKFTR